MARRTNQRVIVRTIRSSPCAEKEKIISGAEDAPQEEGQLGDYRQIFEIDETTNDKRVEEPETSKVEEADDSEVDNTRQVDPSATSDSDSSKERPRFSDPIHWYGILVSPSLRSAQRSFTEAVEQHLPNLASVVVEMRTVEREIERLRSQLR
jgi:hypothetical protein